MPLVTYAEVRSLLPRALYLELNKPVEEGEGTHFDTIEPQAAQMVADKTGITIPTDVADRPAWVLTPMAWLIKKIGNHLLSDQSDAYQREVEADYQNALVLLKSYKADPAAGKAPNTVTGLVTDKGEVRW